VGVPVIAIETRRYQAKAQNNASGNLKNRLHWDDLLAVCRVAPRAEARRFFDLRCSSQQTEKIAVACWTIPLMQHARDVHLSAINYVEHNLCHLSPLVTSALCQQQTF
jgi:hypothetical protein